MPRAIRLVESMILSALLVFASSELQAQTPGLPDPTPTTDLAGPRIGLTLLTGEVANKLEERAGAAPLITQFGWQFERRFLALDEGGTTAITEWVMSKLAPATSTSESE